MWAKRSSAKPAPSPARLRERRRLGRRRFWIACALLCLLVCGALLYGLTLPRLRVSSIDVQGADALLPGAVPADLAKAAMEGAYFGIVPRDSILFFPERRIRASILAAHPEIAAVSMVYRGFTGLTLRVSKRTAAGRWCGAIYTPPPVDVEFTPYCYFFDPSGFIYVAAPPEVIEGTLNPFRVYAPLVGNTQEPPVVNGVEPLRATIARAHQLPDTFNFARQFSAQAVVIRGDEVDIILDSGTRVTYVLGREEDANSALWSAHANLNLVNGSIDYIDLRFPGKVYVKRQTD